MTPLTTTVVIQREEKGSDVSLASFLLLDAFRNEADLAVVVTNDSDLAEPIRMVRNDLGKRVAIVNPRKRTALDLENIADEYKKIRFWSGAGFPVPLLIDRRSRDDHQANHLVTGIAGHRRQAIVGSQRGNEFPPFVSRNQFLGQSLTLPNGQTAK